MNDVETIAEFVNEDADALIRSLESELAAMRTRYSEALARLWARHGALDYPQRTEAEQASMDGAMPPGCELPRLIAVGVDLLDRLSAHLDSLHLDD